MTWLTCAPYGVEPPPEIVVRLMFKRGNEIELLTTRQRGPPNYLLQYIYF